MHDGFPRFRLRALSKMRQADVPALAGRGAYGSTADADTAAAEASGDACLLVAVVPGDPHRAHEQQATPDRAWSRTLPLQGGASVSVTRMSGRLYVVGIADHGIEQALLNREEMRLLRAAITVALGDEG